MLRGCPKHTGIGLLLRAMSPDVIATDEIGDARDALALADASRCGVALVATAHAGNIADLSRRLGLRSVLEAGVFDCAVLLGDPPGTIVDTWNYGSAEGGEPDWICA